MKKHIHGWVKQNVKKWKDEVNQRKILKRRYEWSKEKIKKKLNEFKKKDTEYWEWMKKVEKESMKIIDCLKKQRNKKKNI